jgi:3-methyl-2-oxobutanoate hydroxymethyltransferase
MQKINNFIAKKNQEKIICLTAYTYPIAKIIDKFCDIILVGDSLGMTIYGLKDTVDVSLEMMINHGKAVKKGAPNALIMVDMPFGTYEESNQQALENAQKLITQTKCDAVKLEVSPNLVERIEFLAKNKINVVGHVGLLPQRVREIGGYKYQGKDEKSAQEILNTSKEIAHAGAFALVIEATPAILAQKITNEINIPTIGIGASPHCDGQVLVIDDLLGLNQDFCPKFVKRYENLAEKISTACAQFSVEVKQGKFPAKEHLL